VNVSVTCDLHGAQKAAFGCLHILKTLQDKRPRGIFCERDEEGQLNGWCAECEAAISSVNYHWTPELKAQMDARLLCEACFLDAMRLNNVSEEF
jgi:hypothetical protein